MPNESLVLSSLDGIYIGTECLVALFATLGNLLVIWVVRLNCSLQNPTLYFIASLALADVAVGILVTPLAIVVSLAIRLPFYSCLFLCCLLVVFTSASILSLLAIAIDRYLRVKLPTRSKQITRERRVWGALAVCWSMSLLLGLVPMLGWHEAGSSGSLHCRFPSVMSMDYMVYFGFFLGTLVPLLIMCALYLEIFYIIRTKLSQGTAPGRGAGAFYGQELKAAKSLALVVFLFAISWLPLCILNCVSFFHPERHIPPHLLYLAILLSHANSAMNPIVYACKIKKFKNSYLFIVRTYLLCRMPEPALTEQQS